MRQFGQGDERGTDGDDAEPEPQKDLVEQTMHLAHFRARFRTERILITNTPHALDSFQASGSRTELLAKRADMVVDPAVERRKLATQHGSHQLLARHNTASRSQEAV